jgi:hypothetical protein
MAAVVRWTLRGQGAYYVLTGVWPLLHLPSFEAVTGPKGDDWLVRMVGLLAAAIGLTLLLAARRADPPSEIRLLAITSALSFAGVDVFYAAADRIADIYLLDAAVELGFAAVLGVVWRRSGLGA